jgi:putative inorganic carbon (HCO3(-)) transporter
MFDPLSSLVAVAICVPAVLLAARGSSWLIDYLFCVVILNRGIRRFVDYNNGAFNPTSLISLTPIVVGGLAVLVVISRLNRGEDQYSPTTLSIIYRYGAATAAAFVVGLISSRASAIYALGDYIAPIGLIGYGAIFGSNERIFNRWCNSLAITGVIVAGYGIWQFYTIPPWDAFWVSSVNFEGYLGSLEPTKMTLFSTMAERGPAATYLCSCLILVVLRPNTLSFFRLPAAMLIAVAMLLTYSRTTVLQFGIALVLFPILNSGTGKFWAIAIVLLLMIYGETLLQALPGEGRVLERVSTISDLQNDASFVGRLSQLRLGLTAASTEPFGVGIGSHGLGNRISSGELSGFADSTGYVLALRTYGWIGFLTIASVFYSMWRTSSRLVALGLRDRNLFLFRAWFVAGLAATFSGSWVFSATFFWVLAGYCCDKSDRLAANSDDETEEAEWDNSRSYHDDIVAAAGYPRVGLDD